MDFILTWKKCLRKERTSNCLAQSTSSYTETLLGFCCGRSITEPCATVLGSKTRPSPGRTPSLWTLSSRMFPWRLQAPTPAEPGTYTQGKKSFRRKKLQSEVSTATKRLFSLGSPNLKAHGVIVPHKVM